MSLLSLPLLPHKGKPQGNPVNIQLPGKLFIDFEAWDSHRPREKDSETQGPKYCHSPFDAITVGKIMPPMPGFLFPSSPTSPRVSRAGVQVGEVSYKIQKSRATSILQGNRSMPSRTLLPPVHFALCPNCARCLRSHQFGKLGSRNAPSLEGRQ